jgi:Terminase large subunit, T4likevirus-type, N-terminal
VAEAEGESLDGVEWVRVKLGFAADETQARVLRTSGQRGILNCTRQWGKSTVTAAMAVHHAMTRAGSLTLVVSPSARQSGELLRKAEGFAAKLGIRPKGDGHNQISLAFPNGSRMVGLPGNDATVRGFSAVSLLLVDEASRVSEDLYRAVRPMLAVSGGTLWLMSTPWGKRGFFWDAWRDAGGEWERVQVTARQCPRIAKKFLDEEERAMGERWFRQEYLCEFTETSGALFSEDDLRRAVRADVEPLGV